MQAIGIGVSGPKWSARFPPQAAAGFVEGFAAGFARQQGRVRAQQRRQRPDLLGQRGAGVQVQHGLVIAMQVEHDVGVDRHRQQGLLEVLGRALGGPVGDGTARVLADQGHVGLASGPSLPFSDSFSSAATCL
jgi:hypothetical protein